MPPASRVLVAVSGGADSVALLLLLRQLAAVCGFELAGLAHFNHQLRGGESDGDQAFCRDLAARLGVRFETGSADVAALAREAHVSIEVAARRARYAWFADAAVRLGADRVATGHTQDDQAETVLLRLLRGAGSSGLGGIHPMRGIFVRPLLDVRRPDLVVWLDEVGEPHREDSSNRDLTIPRNWIRHHLLPSLATHLNADIKGVLARQALVFRDESALLDNMAEQARASIESAAVGGGIALDAAGLTMLPKAIARRVVRKSLVRVNDSRFFGFDHAEHVLALATGGHSGQAADLPGIRVELNAGICVLTRRDSRRAAAAVGFNYRLSVPGRVEIPECACVIDAVEAQVDVAQVVRNNDVVRNQAACIDGAAAAGGLWVRSRVPGDVLRPFGLRRRKKLQDVLVDRKVPRADRDRVPIVVNRDGRILWVAGQISSDEGRVTEHTQSVVFLTLTRLGDI
ncbi:MAG: tRNA lysidine(34) synthetase TilS [Acidobacteriota bacterium]